MDQLSFTLLILYFVTMILGIAFRIPHIGYVALLLIVWCQFRILSKNTYKRSQESAKLMGWVYPIQNKWRAKRREFQDRKTHKHYNCPNCKQRLRAPKGRGTITIVCPKCKTEFDKRTQQLLPREYIHGSLFHAGRLPKEASCSSEKQPFLCLFTPA